MLTFAHSLVKKSYTFIIKMQNKLLFGVLAGTLALTSCNNKLGSLSADNFTVTPSPLEAVSGKVPFDINGRFPEKYMKKKAVLKLKPVIRYAGKVADQAQYAAFQGEKVQGNDQEISYKLGGNFSNRYNFTFEPGMEKSELWLEFDGQVGKKKANVPAVKIADGVLATSELLKSTVTSAHTQIAADKYQYAIKQTKQAQIKYLINQANIRNSELKSTSVQDFIKTLREIKADQKGYMLDNIEVSAYASPDGGMKLNTALAQNREKTSKGYVGKQLKATKLDADVDSKYTAEDWEGFKELVSQSNIQDKDIILRVLSMYEDPEEREQQIRNLSAGYKELADEILPELRRARLTINYNLIGRSDDEIEEQYKADASKLSVEELLYAATLTEDIAEQKDIYTKTSTLYPDDYRAYNNLATLAYQQGDLTTAKNYLAQVPASQADAPEVNANLALIAMAEGNNEAANNYLMKATSTENYNEVLGNLQVAAGNYAKAANCLKGVKTNTAALAQILNKDYTSAANTLKAIARPDATTSYLKAIVAARTNQDAAVVSNLKDAFAKDSSLKKRAANDLEFVSLFNDAAFQSIVK